MVVVVGGEGEAVPLKVLQLKRTIFILLSLSNTTMGNSTSNF